MANPPITRFTSLAVAPGYHSGNPNNGLYAPQLTNNEILNIPTNTKKNGGIWYNNNLNELQAQINGVTRNLASTIPGTGFVIGPNVAIDSNIATFDGTTGKIIKDSGIQIGIQNAPSLQSFANPLKTPDSTLEYIKFNIDVAAIFVNSLMPVEFITNHIGEDHVCSLFTGGLPSSSSSPSALVEIQSSIGALLLSRMTTTQRNALSVPAGSNGMMLFNTTSKTFDGFDGTYWRSLAQVIDDGSNFFIGTNAGSISLTGLLNTGVGVNALFSITSGNRNASLGNSALHDNTTASDNSAFGYQSLNKNITGSPNSAFGSQTLYSNTTGNNNSAFGYQSLLSNISNNNNSAFGYQSLLSNISNGNDAFGYLALANNTTGTPNAAFGNQALLNNNTGNFNSAFAMKALGSNTTGNNNSAFGYQSLTVNVIGNFNSAFGTQSLSSNIADGNDAFGYQTLASNTTGTPNAAFGNQALLNNNTGNFNSAFGGKALLTNLSGSFNSAFGSQVLQSNSTGNSNSGFSKGALYSNITGNQNCAFGVEALYTINANYNCAFGYRSLYSNVSGAENSSFGTQALFSNTANDNCAFGSFSLNANISGAQNSAFGRGSSQFGTTGNFNSSFGRSSLSLNTGDYNSAFGFYSGSTQALYTNCVFLGAYADTSANNLTNAIAIGYQASVGASNSMVLGGSGGNQLSVGIGVTPNAQLQLPNIHANRKFVLYQTANNDHQVFGLGTASGIFRHQIDNTTSSYTWNTAASSSASNELMRLTGGGFLGIGTAAPNAFLQFSGALTNRKIVLFEGANNDHQVHALGTNSGVFRFQTAATTDNYIFYAGVSTTSSNEIMRIGGASATLLLGTTTSSAKLVVSGGVQNITNEASSIRATSALTSTKIELENTNSTAALWEIRSLSSGALDFTYRTGSLTPLIIDKNGSTFIKQSYASYNATGSAATVTSATPGVYVKLNPNTTGAQSISNSYSIVTGAGAITITYTNTIIAPGPQNITVSFSATQSGVAGELTTFAIFKNGFASGTRLTSKTIDLKNTTASPQVVLNVMTNITATNDYFELDVSHSVASRTVTISDLNITISST